MTTSRSRYSTAPTYGMQKRPAPKKQPVQGGPAYPPAQQAPQGPYGQPAMPGYVQQPPQAPVAPYPAMHQQNAFAPGAPAYAAPPGAYAPQAGYGQSAFAPQQRQQAAVPPQPVPYPPQQPYAIQPLPQEYAVREKSRQGEGWLQILLLAVLPILFIATLLISLPALKMVFIGLAVLSIIAMWMRRSFVTSARATLSLVYGALILVCAVSLATGGSPRDTTTSARGGGGAATGQQASSQQTDQSGLVGQGSNTTPDPAPSATPEPPVENGENSAAWQRLSQFFSFWNTNNIESMLDIVSPTWKSEQEKANVAPNTALFLVMGNRSPLDHTFEKISGTEADSTRTITMTSTIDRRNSRDPVKIRFQVLMLKDAGEWYVDPNSLSSNAPAEDQATQANAVVNPENANVATATPKPAATPTSKTKLYYNAKGGKYYHAESDCSSVAKEYLPLTSFYYKDINSKTLKHLVACPTCNAPARP